MVDMVERVVAAVLAQRGPAAIGVRLALATDRRTHAGEPVVGWGGGISTAATGGGAELREDRLGISRHTAGRGGTTLLRLLRGQTKDFLLDQFDGLVEILKAQYLGLLMAAVEELLDLPFVPEQERIDVLLVEHASTLGLRENQIAEEKQTEPAVEREPVSWISFLVSM